MGDILEYSSSVIFDSIILILAGKKDMHESLDEFTFWPDTTTNSRVICPCASEKWMYNVVNTLARAYILDRIFFILSGNKDYLKVWNLRQIQPRALELAALERIKKFPYNWRNLVNTLAPSF